LLELSSSIQISRGHPKAAARMVDALAAMPQYIQQALIVKYTPIHRP